MHIYILTIVCINYFSFTLVVHKFPLNKICREGLLLNVTKARNGINVQPNQYPMTVTVSRGNCNLADSKIAEKSLTTVLYGLDFDPPPS